MAFSTDPRGNKIDLGIGIYKDAMGSASVLSAVKAAEGILQENEPSKAYIGIAGDEAYNQQMLDLVLGESSQAKRTRVVQTPGGGGAIRLLAEVLVEANANATVWISEQTWVN